MLHTVQTIDAHVGGQALRLVVEGLPRPTGSTMTRQHAGMSRQRDALRRSLVLEPRGHLDMCAALLTDPVSPAADSGVVFWQHDGLTAISGHGVMAVATIAVERGLLGRADGSGSDVPLVFDTLAGRVEARARLDQGCQRRRVASVVLTNVPSFVHAAGRSVTLGTRHLRVDIAFGGVFYAIVDAEALGVPLDAGRLPDLRRLGSDIRAAINADGGVAHPLQPQSAGIAGVIFTGPPLGPDAQLRNITVVGDGAVDRSPCATGTAAVMAVLDEMGLLDGDRPFVHESVAGTLHQGRVARRTQVGTLPAIVAEVEGRAWVTGDHTFYIDDDDLFTGGMPIPRARALSGRGTRG